MTEILNHKKRELPTSVLYRYKEHDTRTTKHMCDVIVYYRYKCKHKMISR